MSDPWGTWYICLALEEEEGSELSMTQEGQRQNGRVKTICKVLDQEKGSQSI